MCDLSRCAARIRQIATAQHILLRGGVWDNCAVFRLSKFIAMTDHHQLSHFIWQIADLLRGPYRPPQYERVMLPLTVLRRFDCERQIETNLAVEYVRPKSREPELINERTNFCQVA